MAATRRNENIDSFRGLLVLVVFLGHANLFFNAFRPYFQNEGGLALVPWGNYSDGIIRLFLHPVAASFIGLAGYTADRFFAAKPGHFLVRRGLMLIFLDLTVVTFAFTLGGFGGAPTFGAVSVTGFGMLVTPIVRKFSLRLIAGTIVVLKLAAIVLPYSPLFQYAGLRALFYFYFAKHFYVLYAPLGWLIIFLAGVALSRLQQMSLPLPRFLYPGVRRDLFTVVFALGLGMILQKVFLLHNPQLYSFFQTEHYPAGNAYLMFSAAWAVLVFHLARALSSVAAIKSFLGHLARHGLAYYLFHLYVFGLISRCFQLKGKGTFATGAAFFTAFVGCLFLLVSLREGRIGRIGRGKKQYCEQDR